MDIHVLYGAAGNRLFAFVQRDKAEVASVVVGCVPAQLAQIGKLDDLIDPDFGGLLAAISIRVQRQCVATTGGRVGCSPVAT